MGGVVYLSLKMGHGESVAEDGRFFAYYTEDELRALLSSIDGLVIRDFWVSDDRTARTDVQWLNVIASNG